MLRKINNLKIKTMIITMRYDKYEIQTNTTMKSIRESYKN